MKTMVLKTEHRWFSILILIGMCVYLILHFLNSLWSVSVDIAAHYGLIARIAEYWQLPAAFDRSLGPMNIYPRYSHTLAAIIGTLLGSPFAGMQVTALVSLAALWSGFALMFFSLPRRVLWIVSMGLASVFLANWAFVHLEIFGHELIVNFFFAQLTAQAVAMILLAFVLYVDRAGISPVYNYIILAISAPVMQQIHLGPAVEILVMLALLVAVHTLDAKRGERIKTLLPGLFAMFAALLLLVLSPAFRFMLNNSENNGYLMLVHTPTVFSLAVESMIVIILSGFLLLQWWQLGSARAKGILIKYLSLFGITVAGLCLLQVVMLPFGFGSEYAVKKYGFALNTSLLLELPLLLVVRFKSRLLDDENDEPSSLPAVLFQHTFLGLFVFMAFFTVLPSQKLVAVADIISVERFATRYRDLNLKDTPGKYDYGLGLFDLSGFDAVISSAILKAPLEGNFKDIYIGNKPRDLQLLGRVLTRQGSIWDFRDCSEYISHNGLEILDGSCVAAKINSAQTICSGTVDFTDKGFVHPFDIAGFSAPWAMGSWSVEDTASFKCIFPTENEVKPTVALVSSYGFVYENHTQRMLISINEMPSAEVIFTTEELMTVELDLSDQTADVLEFQFSFPDAISPKKLGISEDARNLGASLVSIEFK